MSTRSRMILGAMVPTALILNWREGWHPSATAAVLAIVAVALACWDISDAISRKP